MRVLYITHVNDMHGANRSLLQMIEELRSNHHVEPIVVCPQARSEEHLSIEQMCRQKGIECHVAKMVLFKQTTKNPTWGYKLRHFVALFRWTLYLLYQLKGVKFDMVHSNSSVIDMGAYIAMARRVPHIFHLREFGYEDFRLRPILGKAYERWVYKKCTYAIAISRAIEQKFKSYFPHCIRLIYNGIVPKDESLSATHHNSITTFCIIGRLEPNKNQQEVIKACALLKHRTSLPFRLLLIGVGDESYTHSLQQMIADEGLQQQVDFMGYRSDVPQILQGCDVGLMLSTNEAFGRVTVEYMMQNLAVIASNTGANPEIIKDGETGIIYELGNVEQLAAKMQLLIEDHVLLMCLATKGKQRAYSHFTSLQNSENVYKLYQTLHLTHD